MSSPFSGTSQQTHTPSNADAPTPHPSDPSTLVFAKPHEELQPFPDFLDYLIHQEHHPDTSPAEVRYAQTRTPPLPSPLPPLITLTENNNLPHEYPLLAPSVPRSIPFAHIALSPTNPTSSSPPPLPDATNLWIGNSRSTTALHRDAYENIYVQIRGRKTFVLLPPACQPCVNETGLKGGTYHRSGDGGLELVLDGDGDGGEVPFAPVWDPDRPGERGTRWSGLARGGRVVLGEGDMLYLPCLW